MSKSKRNQGKNKREYSEEKAEPDENLIKSKRNLGKRKRENSEEKEKSNENN